MNLYEFIYNMTVHISLITILFILISFIALYFAYDFIISRWFSNGNDISYDTLIKPIQVVSKDNYFMNYGIWENDYDTLEEANKRLVNLIFEKADIKNKKSLNILDVGCGYGEQDSTWFKKLDKSCSLTAIDISEKQIEWAKKKTPEINYELCNALDINKKFKEASFDRVISLESAFHYKERQEFFKHVRTLLKEGGKFVITDITLKDSHSYDNIILNIFLKVFSDILHFPKENLISASEWESQLSSEFNVIEFLDITDRVFNSYYKHFVNKYFLKSLMPTFISDRIIQFFHTFQPFSYRVAVLSKS